MSSDRAIQIVDLHKSFPVYSKPHHRLLQMLTPRTHKEWFREFRALQGVNLTVAKGETVGVVGRNGSGKSTLLQLICGTLTPTSGHVQVSGRVAALLELGAGFNPDFTGRENVFLNGTILGLTRERVAEKFDEIASFAAIGEFMDQPVKTYSSGMYVRLAFSVAINSTPDILIIDEALSVGDEAFQRKCFARIDSIRDAGATVLFVSHSAGTVVDLCDRAILLDAGELISKGTPKHVVAQYQKLIFSSPDKAMQIREEIRATSMRDVDAGCSAQDPTSDGRQAETPLESRLQPYFDEEMEPSSTVVYENRGAQILSPQLQTVDGRQVNVLVPGDQYVYTYDVVVERDLADIRCGMMIRTITGFEIAGAATSTAHDVNRVDHAGSRLHVSFRFRCLLTPGTYFMNAGVLARFGAEEHFVDRRVDVVMFRVQHVASRLATGVVDLDVVPHLRTLSS